MVYSTYKPPSLVFQFSMLQSLLISTIHLLLSHPFVTYFAMDGKKLASETRLFIFSFQNVFTECFTFSFFISECFQEPLIFVQCFWFITR